MEDKSLKTLGIETWGGGSRSRKAKQSKISILTALSKKTGTKSLDIGVLNINELLHIASKVGSVHITEEVPSSRLKKPYVEILQHHFPKADLTKLSVSSLKELIGAFHA